MSSRNARSLRRPGAVPPSRPSGARETRATPTEARIRAILNGIVDPCSATAGAPAGLDEMGLVREVWIDARPAGAYVRVALALTEPTCLMGVPFLASAQERLAALEGVAEVEVSLAPEVEWTPAELSPAYAARLERLRAGRRARASARRLAAR
jgi:metal-sulfur cluster biosynthetic enzyme